MNSIYHLSDINQKYIDELELFLINTLYTMDLMISEKVNKPIYYKDEFNILSLNYYNFKFNFCKLYMNFSTVFFNSDKDINELKSLNQFTYKLEEFHSIYKLEIYSIPYEKIEQLKDLVLEMYQFIWIK